MNRIILGTAIIGLIVFIIRSVHLTSTVDKARRLLPSLLGVKAIEGEELRALLKVYGAKLPYRTFYRFMAQQHMWVKASDSTTVVKGKSVKGFMYRRMSEPPTLPPKHQMFDKRKG
ncbi:MAG: hypothetical protein KBC33_02020 [Candidatus Pacebacteria bacterium]|nr:hypothetical protein [Candidatus Paceibacterota bacterium]